MYDVLNFKDETFQPVGIWHNTSRLDVFGHTKFLGGETQAPTSVANNLKGMHLTLGTLTEAPLVYLAEDCQGNHCFTGICPDIVRRLAEDLGFTYHYHMPGSQSYYCVLIINKSI